MYKHYARLWVGVCVACNLDPAAECRLFMSIGGILSADAAKLYLVRRSVFGRIKDMSSSFKANVVARWFT